jgi:hypothetical protein
VSAGGIHGGPSLGGEPRQGWSRVDSVMVTLGAEMLVVSWGGHEMETRGGGGGGAAVARERARCRVESWDEEGREGEKAGRRSRGQEGVRRFGGHHQDSSTGPSLSAGGLNPAPVWPPPEPGRASHPLSLPRPKKPMKGVRIAEGRISGRERLR